MNMVKEKIKSLVEKKTKGNSKKTIENLIVFLILLVVTIVAINTIWGGEPNNDEIKPGQEQYKVLADEINESNFSENTAYNLEDELEDILAKISGVGKVQVLITYSETSQVVAMHNEVKNTSKTEETDTNGGIRVIESSDENKEIIVDSENNPITEKIVMPKIEGAIVIAEGGENVNIKTDIIQAVAAVTGLSTHKIQVFKMSNN